MSETEASTNEAGLGLSLADIQNAVKVIDYAAEQGAFKGWSVMEQVLVVRNRLNAFLGAAAATVAPEEGDTETAAAAE